MFKLAWKAVELFVSRHFIKFFVVGILSTIINYALFYLLFAKSGASYVSAYAAGYIAGIFVGFLLNKVWSFESKSKQYASEIARYFAIYTLTLVFGMGFLNILVIVFKIDPLVANVFTIGFTMVANFLGIRIIVFTDR